MPPAEVDLDEELVRALLVEQQPDLARLPIGLYAEGWDNTLFRLGEDLLVRLPRRAAAAELIVNESIWLPQLGPTLPLPVPVPLRVGRPGRGFPWNWTVVPWFEGRPVGVEPLPDPTRTATLLGSFLAALHQPAPPIAPRNTVRGGPLADRLDSFEERLARLPDLLDVVAVQAAFERAVAIPAWSGPPMWLHGDLHPHNVLRNDDEVVAVIDFGDITAGDPATDLMAAWSLFDAPERCVFRRAAGSPERPIDEEMWKRARGWAIGHAVALLASGADSPWHAAVGLRTIARALD